MGEVGGGELVYGGVGMVFYVLMVHTSLMVVDPIHVVHLLLLLLLLL